MPALALEYAILRVVPRVEREEFVNVGVLLFCDARALVTAAVELDPARLLAIAPDVDLDVVRAHLSAVVRTCHGGEEAGPIGHLPVRERWRWLVAPKSTIVQTSPAHGALAEDPAAFLEHVMERVVRVRRT